jgi:hypothetical protein
MDEKIKLSEILDKCENCIKWSKRYNDKGKCLMSMNKNEMMQSGCGLITHKDFGCILFKQKD